MGNQSVVINGYEISTYQSQIVVKYYSNDELFGVKFYEQADGKSEEKVEKVLKEDTEYNRANTNVRTMRDIERHVREVLKRNK